MVIWHQAFIATPGHLVHIRVDEAGAGNSVAAQAAIAFNHTKAIEALAHDKKYSHPKSDICQQRIQCNPSLIIVF